MLISSSKPGSILQLELQPSFDMLFPSSHSASNINPSPHYYKHAPLKLISYPFLHSHWLFELRNIYLAISQKRHLVVPTPSLSALIQPREKFPQIPMTIINGGEHKHDMFPAGKKSFSHYSQ